MSAPSAPSGPFPDPPGTMPAAGMLGSPTAQARTAAQEKSPPDKETVRLDTNLALPPAAQEMEQILPTSAPASQGGVRGKGKGKGGAARPTRSSGRLKGDAPEGSLGRLRPKRAGRDADGGGPTMAGRTTAGKRAHSQAEDLYNKRWAGQQKRETIVGTASYKHTLMRVLSMGEDGLARRITAIENACGKHAVVKMKLFAQVLYLEKHYQLAGAATVAYKRLRKKLGNEH